MAYETISKLQRDRDAIDEIAQIINDEDIKTPDAFTAIIAIVDRVRSAGAGNV